MKSLSCVRLVATPWTEEPGAPLSMGFSRQEYWSGLPFPSPGDLPNPGIEPRSPALQANALPSEPPGKRSSKWWWLKDKEEKSHENRTKEGPRAGVRTSGRISSTPG